MEPVRHACGVQECPLPSQALTAWGRVQFRRALRRPNPAEREYLERQYVGIGLQLGKHSKYALPFFLFF